MYVGIEGGGTKWLVGVGTDPADLSDLERVPTTSPGETIPRVIEAALRMAGQRSVRAVGLASFGPLELAPESDRYGCVTNTPKPGWSGTDVVGPLASAFGQPVGFDTDVNAAALSEAAWGAARGLGSVVYVTVGTGIGGGALIEGQPVHGLTHPEMGHMLVRRHPDDSFAGLCPFHGDCLEGLASGPAVQARWGAPADQLGDQRHDAMAIEAFYLGQLVVAATSVLSPHRVVLGGGLMHVDGLLEATRRSTEELLAGYLDAEALGNGLTRYIVPAGLGDRAGVLGAIALARRAAGDDPLA